MNIDEAIKKFSSYHPITIEDQEAFNIAIDCMKFTMDFLPLNATPERMEHALNLLNLLEYVLNDKKANEKMFAVVDEGCYEKAIKKFSNYLKDISFCCDCNDWHSFQAIDTDDLDELVENFLKLHNT